MIDAKTTTITFVLGMLAMFLYLAIPREAYAQTDQRTQNASQIMDMTLTRTFNVSREQLWNAWQDPELVKRWWGPRGWTAPIAKMEFREGGKSLVCMKSAEGFEIYNTWSYTKLVPLERIEFVQHFADNSGKQVTPAEAGLPPVLPDAVPHVITFKSLGKDKTEMIVTESGYASMEIVEMSRAGMDEVLDKLEELLQDQD
jgi:uncharacterized protein YndB with AHSA1/START domain